jgi:hypothetical protein
MVSGGSCAIYAVQISVTPKNVSCTLNIQILIIVLLSRPASKSRPKASSGRPPTLTSSRYFLSAVSLSPSWREEEEDLSKNFLLHFLVARIRRVARQNSPTKEPYSFSCSSWSRGLATCRRLMVCLLVFRGDNAAATRLQHVRCRWCTATWTAGSGSAKRPCTRQPTARSRPPSTSTTRAPRPSFSTSPSPSGLQQVP